MLKPLTPYLAANAAKAVGSLRTASPDANVGTAMKRAFPDPKLNDAFQQSKAVLLTGSSGIGPFNKSTGFGSYSKGVKDREGEALLALRGTLSAHDAGTDLCTTLSPGQGRTGVHHGFQKTFESFRDSLDLLINSTRPTAVHVVGHSLGGALATIAAGYIANKNIAVKLYTFGAPRVGLAGFAKNFDKAVGSENIFRCLHGNDPVPMLPIFPFMHVGIETGGLLIRTPGDVIVVGQHFMETYFEDLKDKKWDDLERVKNPFRSLAAAQAWLERAADTALHIPVLSSTNISLVGQALNMIIQGAAFTGMAATWLGGSEAKTIACNSMAWVGDTALDILAQILSRAAALGAMLGAMVRNALIVCMKLVGLQVALCFDGAELVARFVRWILQTFFNAIASKAAQALQVVRG